jgi:serine/threonine-protein kinase HipA
LVNQYCTFPAVENLKLFKLVIFNYLVGNEDMHLKNFSIITEDVKVALSPSYDLINTTIEYNKKPEDEIALPLKGKKNKLSRNLLIDYFGMERCKLTSKSTENILEIFSSAIPTWKQLIDISFVSKEMKDKYHELLDARLSVLNIQ